jgi:hypothetical protein
MYDRAMDGMIKVLLKASSPNGLAFVSDYNGNGTYACPSHSDYVPISLYGDA